jgi:class 3 adenylate cyclase/tetratricopeptide (TPR) repeat protein
MGNVGKPKESAGDGAPRAAACPACGILLSDQALFCSQCGRRLGGVHRGAATGSPRNYTPGHLTENILQVRAAFEGERKQVSVLFCDIVCSTELAERLGAEPFHDLIDEFFSLALADVHRLEGTINQFLGDGFMALFGAPIAHEDHTRRAVLAALALRENVAQRLGQRGVRLRMGISTGPVVVGKIGDDLRMDYTAFGDTTVLAARLQAAADAGDILLGHDAAERVRGYFVLEPADTTMVKGGPVVAQRVLGLGARRSRIEGSQHSLAPFVGRDYELQTLVDAFVAASGGDGRVVGIVGDPGLGKSRLVLEFRASLGPDSAYEGRCASYGAGIPYLPLIDLLRRCVGIEAQAESQAIAAKLRGGLEEAGLDPDAALPFLLLLLGQREGTDVLDELDPASIRGRTFDILREYWKGQSRRHPIALIIEDLHWIDRTSEEFITSLVGSLHGHRILLVTTFRPGYTPPWDRNPPALSLALRPLDPASSRKLVLATLARATDGQVTDSIIANGDGNPFFLEELAHASLHRGESEQHVPETVQEVLAARIDRLESDAKRALQAAAVLGRDFSVTLLAAILDDEDAVATQLEDPVRLELLFAQPSTAGPTFVFKHALTQEVAYAGLLDKQRRRLHGRAGRAIEQIFVERIGEQYELLAYHFSRSDEREKAAEYLMLANRKAAARNAMQEAIDYFYAALQVLESLPDTIENRRRRLRLVFDQTGEFHFLHRHKEYFELILRHQALALEVNEPDLLGAFYGRLGHRQWTAGQITASLSTLERAVELCEQSGNDTDAAAAYIILAWAHVMLGNYDMVPVYRDKGLAKLGINFDPVWYSFARAAAGLARAWAGRWQEAIDECRLAIEEGGVRNDVAIVSYHSMWSAYTRMNQRDWADARRYCEVAVREAPTTYFQGFPQALQARMLCEAGDTGGVGLATLQYVESLLERSGHSSAWAYTCNMLGEGLLAAGDNAKAKAAFDRVDQSAEAAELVFLRLQARRALGEIASREGDWGKAKHYLELALDAARRSRSQNELGLTLAAYGRLLWKLGERATARQHLREAADLLEALGTMIEPDRIRQELQSLDPGEAMTQPAPPRD